MPSETLVFGHFEHKIWVFVRFCPSEPPFSGFSSTKSGFLCFFWLWNPRFRAFRAQNRHVCALFASETPIFGHSEHKIEVFVRFCQQVSSRCCRSSSLQGTQCRVSRGAATLPHRLPLRSIPPQRFASGSSHSRGHGRPRSVRRSSRLRGKCLSMDCHRCEESAWDVPPENAPRKTALWERATGNVPPENAPPGNAPLGSAPYGNALCGEYYSPALRRSAFSATWSWSITS